MFSATPALRAAQFDAILRNDEMDFAITLPDRINLDYQPDQLADAFRLCHAVWLEGWSVADLSAICSELWRSTSITPDNQLLFKHIRARFKQIRFTSAMFGTRHRYPKTVDLITSIMGNLQDAFKNGKPGLMRRDSLVLRFILGGWFMALMRREVASFRPSSAAGLKAYIGEQAQEIERVLALPEVSALTYHDTRKIISRHRAAFSTLNLVFPSEDNQRTALYLATINGIMGNYHDELMAQKLAGTRDYTRDTEPLDADLRMRLETLSSALIRASQS